MLPRVSPTTAAGVPGTARPLPDPSREAITGLVLAGGRGSRMGGVDKGLQPHAGRALVAHVLERLRPQVGPLLVNANRHLEAYAAFGVPVCSDRTDERPGPLAGLEAGLACATTPWLACVPCDAPLLPTDLVARLAAAVRAQQADLAVAAIPSPADAGAAAADDTRRGGPRLQPVFCLLATALQADLSAYLAQGGRRVEAWTARHRRAVVVFDDAAAFTNVNTPQELAALAPR